MLPLLTFTRWSYDKSPSFVGAAEQTRGINRMLQTLGGLVFLFATKCGPKLGWIVKKVAISMSHICCLIAALWQLSVSSEDSHFLSLIKTIPDMLQAYWTIRDTVNEHNLLERLDFKGENV